MENHLLGYLRMSKDIQDVILIQKNAKGDVPSMILIGKKYTHTHTHR